MTALRHMLLDPKSAVIGEVVGEDELRVIGEVPTNLFLFRGRYYIYDRRRDNGEYRFYCDTDGYCMDLPEEAFKDRSR